jgi:hypothetical protein
MANSSSLGYIPVTARWRDFTTKSHWLKFYIMMAAKGKQNGVMMEM